MSAAKFMGRLLAPIAASAPSSPVVGQVYFNSTDSNVYVYKTSVGWTAVGSGGGGGGAGLNAYKNTNVSTTKTYDAASTTVNTLANVLGTVLADLAAGTANLSGYTVTNGSTVKTLNASSCTLNDLAAVLSSVIVDLSADRALTGYRILNVTTDRSFNASSTSIFELACVLGTLIGDLSSNQQNGGANQKVSFNVGDGTTTTFTLSHFFSSRDLQVVVREAASPWGLVDPTVEFLNTDQVNVTFLTAPTTNQYTVTVISGNLSDSLTTIANGKFISTIGDGTNTTIDVLHGLNSKELAVSVRETVTPFQLVIPAVFFPDNNTLRLVFDTAPTTGQYQVTLVSGTAGTGGANVSSRQIYDTGVSNQIRAGRQLAAADFTTNLGLATPLGLWNLSALTDSSGNARDLVNKGSVTLTGVKGVTGTASEAAQFTGSTAQALYILSASWQQIATGSWGCWFRTAKRGTQQVLISKAVTGGLAFELEIGTGNVLNADWSTSGSGWATTSHTGVTDVCDDRWHFAVWTYDASTARLYVDGALEASQAITGGLYTGSTAAFTLGGIGDAANPPSIANPFYGRMDEVFFLADILDENQIRHLMSVKVAHGYSGTPNEIVVSQRKRKRGGPYVTTDFTATPKSLYNFTAGALTDAGSLGVTLTNTAASTSVAGVDGQSGGAYYFNGTSQYLSAASAGLPTGTNARSMGAWFKSTGSVSTGSNYVIMSYGTGANLRMALYNISSPVGTIEISDGTTATTSGGYFLDGQWHFAVMTYDTSAVDGQKLKIYVDGKLLATSTTTIASTGAGSIAIGNTPGAVNYFGGSIDGAFVTDYAMDSSEIQSLLAKGSMAMGASPLDDDRPLNQIVQGVDSSSIYVLGDVRKRISGRINADGTIAESIGGDFRVVRAGVGDYTIYWPPGFFTAPPALTMQQSDANYTSIYIFPSASATSARYIPFTTNTPGGVDRLVSFTAEGRGPLPSQNQLDFKVRV